MRMALRVKCVAAALWLLALSGQAFAQDALVQRIYAGMENAIHNDYEELRTQFIREAMQQARSSEKQRLQLKMISYNKAVLLASCAADAERDRSPAAPRIPSSENLVMRTCVEIKVGQLQKFGDLSAYVEVFFPDRIRRCGERARLREQEKALPPYAFLEIETPRLYDFARYNECLMTK